MVLLCTFVMWCTKQPLKYMQPVAAGGNSFIERVILIWSNCTKLPKKLPCLFAYFVFEILGERDLYFDA